MLEFLEHVARGIACWYILDDDLCTASIDCMAAPCFGLPDNLARFDGIAEVD